MNSRLTQLTENIYGISKVSRATGAAAIALTIAPAQRWILKEIRVHLSAVGTSGTLSVTVDHGTNAVYDFVLHTQDMSSVTDLVYQPARPLEFGALDEVDITWVNAGTKTYGIEVLYALI